MGLENPLADMSTDPLFMKQAGQYYWYHNDHLGTPQVMTTSSGAVVWKAQYTSFGKATVDSAATVVNPLRFAGQYEDDETGFHQNYFRYYDPVIGRYLSSDPIGFSGGINLYAYVQNNPINLIDPLGLADYFVSWTSLSASRKNKAGGTHISGVVVSLEPNSNGMHNAVAFSGNFVGLSLGAKVGGSYTRTAIFKDGYESPDVTRIAGYSSFSSVTVSLFWKGGISIGIYAFGDLNQTSDAFSEVEGLELSGASMQGEIILEGEVYEIEPESLRKHMGLEDPLKTGSASKCK